ncbi:hypothetical protein SELR_pSRC500030 (plasmid) [Selenomonas ruminantium subsp. lactilytica TAM6421]|uniref:DOD-type homing endonuclease domain-containing protein n=1 Tax=Selenomonas ruminantium subsp. lactilytica (strain NBRC 103574 / TAM6421) TaxID=927704 RepID=I0GWP0_SELRL|nr:helix-turn-helix domain-containing protein [Selenomonas ruminantium]BAL85177.1 hypothetical protein SELR_pSRC500030 [Selenomonas ruminantium subsp. lactilytica TAM6421]
MLTPTAIKKKIRDEKIIKLYQDGDLIGAIAKALAIGRHTVTRTLKKFNLYEPERSKLHMNKEKVARNERVIKMYQSGMSFRAIEKAEGIGHSTAEYIIHTYIERSPIQYSLEVEGKENMIRHRKYEFDFDFFETIDTEEKAYWLGFLYADSTITEKSVRLDLQAKDLDHLIKFRDALRGFDKEPRYREEENSYLIYFNSKKMVQDLVRLGCMPRKTDLIRFPTEEQVPKHLRVHFIRGYIDGDGGFYPRKKRTNVNMFHVTSNIQFVTELKRILFEGINKTNDVKINKKKNCENTGTLNLGGNIQLTKVFNYLYGGATVFLKRKYDILASITQPYREKAVAN